MRGGVRRFSGRSGSKDIQWYAKVSEPLVKSRYF